MRFGSPGSLRRAMSSSSYYYRRASHRPRRTFSARPSPPPPPPHDAAPDAELVSGDAHFSAVRAANDALRRGGGGRAPWAPPPTYGYGSQPRYGHGHGHQRQPAPLYGYGSQPPYGYGQGHRQQPASPYGYGSQLPYGYGHPQQPPSPYGYGAPPPYGYGHPQPYGGLMPNVGFQPSTQQQPSVPLQPRLAVYRRWWRFAQQRLPHNAERFKVLSYNILADYLAKEHRELYNHIPDYILDWNWRKDKLLFEFGLWSPDIICLQEVDKFPDLDQELASRGYNGVWKMRTGKAADGCAVFWKTDRFQLCYEEHIEFNKLDLRDNIAQICVLESTVPRNVQTESACLPTSSNDPQQAKQVVICNIHVLYNPRRGDIKLGQVRMLLERAYAASKMWNDAPVILCGDFNSTPKSPLYNFISQQKLDLSGLARHEISGQYSTSSSQRPYTRYNMSRPFPSRATNSRDGIMTSLNNLRPQTETTNLEQKSCPAGREPVLANTSSSAAEDAHRSDGQVQGISHHADTAESQECSRVGSSSEGCSGGAKLESGQEPTVTDYPSNRSMVNSEILPSDSGEIVDSSRLDLSSESSGFKYSFEESEGSYNVPVALEDMHSDVISEKVTCDLEENSVQSDTQEGVSKDNPVEKEKANEFMLCQNHCTNNGSESSELSDSLKLADTVNQMSNIRLEEESNSEATNLTSPAKSTKLPNSATSDVCDQHCTSEVTNQDSDCAPLSSCSNNFENDNCALEDDKIVSEVSCSDENSDPSFFKELLGDDGCLLEDEDQLPTTSDGPPFEQEEVASAEKYYDPYRWTPEEIRAASGNEACTFLEHKLKVRSVYTDVEDYEGTKDVNEEPQVTSYNTKFMGTVDYIWASEDIQTIQVLDTFPKDILKQTRGFPTKKWGSDHIALVCELAFTKGS